MPTRTRQSDCHWKDSNRINCLVKIWTKVIKTTELDKLHCVTAVPLARRIVTKTMTHHHPMPAVLLQKRMPTTNYYKFELYIIQLSKPYNHTNGEVKKRSSIMAACTAMLVPIETRVAIHDGNDPNLLYCKPSYLPLMMPLAFALILPM